MTNYLLKHVEILTPDQLLLPGLLFEPHTKTKRALIFVHGTGGSSVFYDVQGNALLAEQLAAIGMAYLPFNNRGANVIRKLHIRLPDGQEGRATYGMAYELIKESVLDIQGAVDFLQAQGFAEIYLAGHSTGANKVCLYDYYQPDNPVNGYLLTGGGDDTGLFYAPRGEKLFHEILETCRQAVEKGEGRELLPSSVVPEYTISYQSLLDMIDPEGDYNVFPFYEELEGLTLTKKEKFREFSGIHKPVLALYGGADEFCFGRVPEVLEILKKQVEGKDNFEFQVLEGADHSFNGQEAQMAAAFTRWLSAH